MSLIIATVKVCFMATFLKIYISATHCLFVLGERCDRCANNYYGNPTIPNGSCQKCECNRNIDETIAGNCEQATGECIKCLYNTAGPHCEYCMDGFYGDATRQECLSKKYAKYSY